MKTGAELFAEALERLGIGEVFTLVGDHLNEALLACAARGLRVFDFRHESSAAHAADAWARLHRRPAVSLVTGGPGHTNSLTGLATAHLAGSPLIAVSGAPAAALAGRQVFQVVDQVGMARPAVKWAAEAHSAAQIPYLLGRAAVEAASHRMGAVHLTIPVDAFRGRTESPLPMPHPPARVAGAPDAAETARAIRLLRAAERPVVIAGSGVWWGRAETALERFLDATQLPCFTIGMARGAVSDRRRHIYGHADPAIHKAVRSIFPRADVVLIVGKRLDSRLAMGGPRLFSPEARFLQIDAHAGELGLNRELEAGLCAEAAAALDALTTAAGARWPAKPWLGEVKRQCAAWKTELRRHAEDAAAPLHPAAVFAAFRRAMPRGTLLSWDGGDFAHWGRAMIPATEHGGWLRLGPMATIGAALPNAVALALANPGRPAAMVTGDGALGFYLAELETLVRYRLPVVILVGNDGGWGLERELQGELDGSRAVACELQASRYDIVMKGFGGGGGYVRRQAELEPAFKRAFSSGRPCLVNVAVRGARSPFTEWQLLGKRG